MIGEGAFGESTIAGATEESFTSYVEMAGAVGDTVAYGPVYYTDGSGNIISSPGVEVSALTVEVATRAALGSPDTTSLDDTFGRSFFDELNDCGSGQIAYANTDTLADAALVMDSLVTFSVWGVRAFSMLEESRHRVRAADGEEHDQTTVVIGRGHLCVTDESVLYPSRGTGVLPIEEDRTFNWSTPTPVYDDSGWGYAYQITTVAIAQVIWPKQPFVDGWPDPTTGVIWAPGATSTSSPDGFCYFRKDITVAADDFYLLYAACDNEGELWLDGQRVLTLGGFLSTFSYSVFLTAGDHTIAVRGYNWPQAVSNPAGLVFALYTQDTAGEPDTLLYHSDATWKIVAYPPGPPGMLVGKVLHVVFDESVARSELLDVTLMFTETADSAGAPWPETVDIATKVGTSVLVFLIELTVKYIDVWMKPGTFELYCWNQGTRPAPDGLVLYDPTDPTDPTSGNMYEQAHTELL